jgi:AcrR family transcriptional regulator
MARRSERGLDEVVEAAAEVFARQGYRRTQMADVARELGVAPGTLYRYVAGKEALFDLCVQRAFVPPLQPPPATLPVPTPAKEEVMAHVRQRLAAMGRHPALRAAVERPAPADPAAEVAELVGELYAFLRTNRRGLQLLERSAADRPELAEEHFGRGRGRLVERWAAWIERRVGEDVFRPVPDARVAARLVIEACAWFAWHRHGDPAPAPIDDAVACDTIALFCARALVKETSRGA